MATSRVLYRFLMFFVLVVFLLSGVGSVCGAVYSIPLRDDVLDDTMLKEDEPGTSFYESAFIHYCPAEEHQRYGMYKFDLTGLDADPADVTEAVLFIYAYDETLDIGEAVELNAYHVYSYPDYSVDGVEWNGIRVNWLNRPDFESEHSSVLDSWVYSNGDGRQWMNFTVTGAVVEEMLQDDRNVSFLVKAVTDSGSPDYDNYVKTRSSETGMSGKPYLLVTVDDPTVARHRLQLAEYGSFAGEVMDDSLLYEDAPYVNYGGEAYINYCSVTADSSRYFGMYKFDLAQVDGIFGADEDDVVYAELNLWAYDDTLADDEAIRLDAHHVYSYPDYNVSDLEWDDSSVTWNNRPDDSDHEYNGVAEDSWVIAGGDTADGQTPFWMSFNVTDMVKDEVGDGDDNLSVLVKAFTAAGSMSSTDLVKTRSKETDYRDQRPFLDIYLKSKVRELYTSYTYCDNMTNYNAKRSIVRDGNGNVHAVFSNCSKGGFDDIGAEGFHAYSLDNGGSWTVQKIEDPDIAPETQVCLFPALGTNGVDLLVACTLNGTYHSDWEDGYSDWNRTNDSSNLWWPSLSVSSVMMSVIARWPYPPLETDSAEILFRGSQSHGTHWYHEWENLTDDVFSDYAPTIAADRDAFLLYAAYEDVDDYLQSGGHHRIMFIKSEDEGNVWSDEEAISEDVTTATDAYRPSLAIDPNSPDHLVVAWHKKMNPNHGYYIWFTNSSDYGETWRPGGAIYLYKEDWDYDAWRVQASYDRASNIHLMYYADGQDEAYGNNEIVHSNSTNPNDGVNTYWDHSRLTNHAADDSNPAMIEYPNTTLDYIWTHADREVYYSYVCLNKSRSAVINSVNASHHGDLEGGIVNLSVNVSPPSWPCPARVDEVVVEVSSPPDSSRRNYSTLLNLESNPSNTDIYYNGFVPTDSGRHNFTFWVHHSNGTLVNMSGYFYANLPDVRDLWEVENRGNERVVFSFRIVNDGNESVDGVKWSLDTDEKLVSKYLTFLPSDDAMVKSADSSGNFGSEPYAHFGAYSGNDRRGMYKFDISSLYDFVDDGDDIVAAELFLYAYEDNLEAGEWVNLTPYRVYPFPEYNISGSEWNESSVTWDNRPLYPVGYSLSGYGSWLRYDDGDAPSALNFSVVDMLKAEVELGTNNLSIYVVTESNADNAGDYVSTRSKESYYDTQHPFLRVTLDTGITDFDLPANSTRLVYVVTNYSVDGYYNVTARAWNDDYEDAETISVSVSS
ncbi:MAG: DNRLRE domain-containing protein [Nanoarchaeota archaeon]